MRNREPRLAVVAGEDSASTGEFSLDMTSHLHDSRDPDRGDQRDAESGWDLEGDLVQQRRLVHAQVVARLQPLTELLPTEAAWNNIQKWNCFKSGSPSMPTIIQPA